MFSQLKISVSGYSGGNNIAREYKSNENIRAPKVRVIGESGEQLGVMTLGDAIQMARQQELDLVEVAPSANPPVCRFMNYGKFRYEATRREKESRKASKSRVNNQVREVRMKTRIGDHDLQAKIRLVKRLMSKGSKVRVSVMFRGREVQHPQIGMELLKTVAEELQEDAVLEKTPSFEGRFLSIILSPSPALKRQIEQKEKQSAKT